MWRATRGWARWVAGCTSARPGLSERGAAPGRGGGSSRRHDGRAGPCRRARSAARSGVMTGAGSSISDGHRSTEVGTRADGDRARRRAAAWRMRALAARRCRGGLKRSDTAPRSAGEPARGSASKLANHPRAPGNGCVERSSHAQGKPALGPPLATTRSCTMHRSNAARILVDVHRRMAPVRRLSELRSLRAPGRRMSRIAVSHNRDRRKAGAGSSVDCRVKPMAVRLRR